MYFNADRYFLTALATLYIHVNYAVTPVSFPQMNPRQWIIASSPTERKIVYVEIKNFGSVDDGTHVLVDSGLAEPVGVALDRDRGALYVADRSAQKIFRYNLITQIQGGQVMLAVAGVRLTILSGHNVSYVAVDTTGDVFYSDPTSNSINRITKEVMQNIAGGLFLAEDLQIVSEKEQEASASSELSQNMLTVESDVPVTDAPEEQPSILSIYEGSINPHVSTPAGLFSDGLNLFWGNGGNGTVAGSAVMGEVDPQAPVVLSQGDQPAPFPATALSNISSATYGLTKTSNLVLWTSEVNGAGVVYGMKASDAGSTVFTFAAGLGQPRGVIWDGDQTAFVADTATGQIWSFPVGRLINSAPMTPTVLFYGAWGLAMLSETDSAFGIASVNPSAFIQDGAFNAKGSSALLVAVVLAMFVCGTSMS